MRVVLLLLCGYHLCYFGAARAQSPEEYGVTTMTPPALDLDPSPKYWPRFRMWQGIPSIERPAKGRLWAT